MNTITISEFSEKFKTKRNPVRQVSPFDNQLLDFDEDELDHLEEQNPNTIWSVRDEENGLVVTPGLQYKGVIGFFICNEKWSKNQEGYVLK